MPPVCGHGNCPHDPLDLYYHHFWEECYILCRLAELLLWDTWWMFAPQLLTKGGVECTPRRYSGCWHVGICPTGVVDSFLAANPGRDGEGGISQVLVAAGASLTFFAGPECNRSQIITDELLGDWKIWWWPVNCLAQGWSEFRIYQIHVHVVGRACFVPLLE